MVKLSIMVPTLVERRTLLERLMLVLQPQLTNDIELLTLEDNREKSLGEKRNILLNQSIGKYVCYVDDDDLISTDYVSTLLGAMETEPDVIGFNSHVVFKHKTILCRYTMANKGNLGLRNNVYEMGVGHLTPIKREVAKSVKYPDCSYGEDSEYCRIVMDIIKTEIYINKVLYYYFTRD